MNKKNVLIAGCGDVGGELARQLLADGSFSVWGLRRSIDKLPAGVHPVAGDLSDPDNLGQWPERIDYLVYSAATDGRGEENYRKAYINGLSNVLARIQNDGYLPERILFTSSTSVYPHGNGEEITESTLPEPASYSGLIMLEAESLIIASSYPATAVRFGGIYGPGRNRMINRVKAGEGCPAEPVIYGNRIHRDDCAGILAYLIKRDMEGLPVDTLYLGVDNSPAPMHEVLHWLAEQLDVELDDSHSAPPRANKRCLNQRIVDAGYSFRFPDYKAGYKSLLEAMSDV
ncbi:NAD(P)-dependent oxidoreductase [Endozoicomonas sp. OPT23]|uniref:SDR family oxidoreductase n=1 Tax=Endozoicomonas sp. OPT23 TaxID=2072845 RepID=UPI00129AB86B|nr:SDR family oxidoreductase [Endozoicomonas sp. OPT23]MRI35134.1 NAD(P)-dependent oxidoreductase [Endozoicomonas sp. OPT23]